MFFSSSVGCVVVARGQQQHVRGRRPPQAQSQEEDEAGKVRIALEEEKKEIALIIRSWFISRQRSTASTSSVTPLSPLPSPRRRSAHPSSSVLVMDATGAAAAAARRPPPLPPLGGRTVLGVKEMSAQVR